LQGRISDLANTSKGENAMFSLSSAKGQLFVSAAFLTLAACANIAYADIVTLAGKLSGTTQVPNNASEGMGTVDATLNTETKELKWKVIYSGLSGPAGAGHFHGPAESGQNSGVALGFKGSVESPITGEATISPEQAKDLLGGKWYVNLHTKAYPGGEIRAQVLPMK
jgi:hypothetical protein